MRLELKSKINNSYMIFCDFDGTITTEDTVDKLLQIYADDGWQAIEKLWQEEKIGSRECLQRQIECINNLSQDQLKAFISKIEIDPYFINFFKTIRNLDIEFYILSDGFKLLINRILEQNGLYNIPVFSSDMSLKNNKLITKFPYYSDTCCVQAGMCKCNVLNSLLNGKKSIYIGDGKSDACAARYADVLFAKNRLINYCKSNNISHIPFNSFKDVKEMIFERGIINAGNALSDKKINVPLELLGSFKEA